MKAKKVEINGVMMHSIILSDKELSILLRAMGEVCYGFDLYDQIDEYCRQHGVEGYPSESPK